MGKKDILGVTLWEGNPWLKNQKQRKKHMQTTFCPFFETPWGLDRTTDKAHKLCLYP